jgi:bacillithiol biosynthesis deacetylase BshB1
MKLDILVFSAHPDDAEVGCGGTILQQVALGKQVGIVDLTRGEMGTRGSAEIRDQEAQVAQQVLGLAARENLGLPDCFFTKDKAHLMAVVHVIRKYQPAIILANAVHDRHPDHGRASELVTEATFLAGLPQIHTLNQDQRQPAWQVGLVLQYIQNMYLKPDILVDVTSYWDQKLKAIRAFKSQFYQPDYSPMTSAFISSPDFFKVHESRAREFGQHIQATYAEGFTCQRVLGVDNLFHLV